MFSERLYKKTLSFVGLCKIFPPLIIYVVFYFSKRRKRHTSLVFCLFFHFFGSLSQSGVATTEPTDGVSGVFQSSMIESNSFETNSAQIGRTSMGVSKNRGKPKWMVYNGKPYLNG